MSTEEVITLKLEQVGFGALEEIKAKTKRLADEVDELTDSYNRGNVKTDVYHDHLKRLSKEASAAEKELKKVADSTDKATKSTQNLGYAGLTAGRAIQDFTQGGIGGILNNIEGMATALGGGPGMAGLLTAVGVAAFIAKPFLDEMFKAVDKGKGQVENLNETIKKLEEKPVKLYVDIKQLEEAKKELASLESGLAAFRKFETAMSGAQRDSGGRVAAIQAEENKGKGDIVNRMAGRDVSSSPFAQAGATRKKAIEGELASLHAMPKGDLDEETAKALRGSDLLAELNTINKQADNLEKEAKSRIGTLWEKAVSGDENAQADLVRSLRRMGQDDLADKIELASPAAIRHTAAMVRDVGAKLGTVANNLGRRGKQNLVNQAERDAKEKFRRQEAAFARQPAGGLPGPIVNPLKKRGVAGDIARGQARTQARKADRAAKSDAKKIQDAIKLERTRNANAKGNSAVRQKFPPIDPAVEQQIRALGGAVEPLVNAQGNVNQATAALARQADEIRIRAMQKERETRGLLNTIQRWENDQSHLNAGSG